MLLIFEVFQFLSFEEVLSSSSPVILVLVAVMMAAAESLDCGSWKQKTSSCNAFSQGSTRKCPQRERQNENEREREREFETPAEHRRGSLLVFNYDNEVHL